MHEKLKEKENISILWFVFLGTLSVILWQPLINFTLKQKNIDSSVVTKHNQ